MSFDKAIKHNKEKRKRYYGAKSFDASCRNGGSCEYCSDNRQYANKKRELSADELEAEYYYDEKNNI